MRDLQILANEKKIGFTFFVIPRGFSFFNFYFHINYCIFKEKLFYSQGIINFACQNSPSDFKLGLVIADIVGYNEKKGMKRNNYIFMTKKSVCQILKC